MELLATAIPSKKRKKPTKKKKNTTQHRKSFRKQKLHHAQEAVDLKMPRGLESSRGSIPGVKVRTFVSFYLELFQLLREVCPCVYVLHTRKGEGRHGQ